MDILTLVLNLWGKASSLSDLKMLAERFLSKSCSVSSLLSFFSQMDVKFCHIFPLNQLIW